MSDFRDHLFKPVNENASTPDGTANDGVSLGVGLGKPHDDGNHLFRIKINDYQASDANFVGDGEEAATSKTNIPAILAARQAGGMPDPKTVSNGINGNSGNGVFKLKPLKDDLGPNG